MPDADDRPAPQAVNTPAELAGALRRLKTWAGEPSLRELAKRTGVPASTVADAMKDARPLPRLEVMRALVSYLDSAEAMPTWDAAWRRAKTYALQGKTSTTPIRPAQLPADVVGFVGRADLLKRLDALLTGAQSPATAVITTMSGGGGVGKTALATHWAHRVAGRFPDGQLYVDLAGFGPDRHRLTHEVLAEFLRSLGVRPALVPSTSDERMALYRSICARSRLLVVLDNAATPEQVRPLLATGRGCVTVVTTRHSFTGLTARDGAERLFVERLTITEARQLLSTILGDRVPLDVSLMVELCAGLPLTLRLVAQRLFENRGQPLEHVLTELNERRLEFFASPDDPFSDVETVFSWSLGHLTPEAIRLFELIGLHPGRHLDIACAAALIKVSYVEAERTLAELVRANLVEEAGLDRFGMHDLLRSYSAKLAANIDHQTARDARLRLADYYLHSVVNAKDTMHPWDAPAQRELPGNGTLARRFTDAAEANTWHNAELDNFVSIARLLAEHGLAQHARHLSRMLRHWLVLQGRYDQALAIFRHALDAAETSGDPDDTSTCAFHVADIHWRTGQYDEALKWFLICRNIRQQAGDIRGLVHALGGVGTAHQLLGNLDEAVACFEAGLDLARRTAQHEPEVTALCNLAEIQLIRHDTVGAIDRYSTATEIARNHNYRAHLANSMIGLGTALIAAGTPEQAAAPIDSALALARELESADFEAHALHAKGLLLASDGQRAPAHGHLTRALRLFTELGNAPGQELVAKALADLNQ